MLSILEINELILVTIAAFLIFYKLKASLLHIIFNIVYTVPTVQHCHLPVPL